MSKVIFDISMSLDEFITGANRTPEALLGDESEHLHDWALNRQNEYNRSLISLSLSTLGAVICGRRGNWAAVHPAASHRQVGQGIAG